MARHRHRRRNPRGGGPDFVTLLLGAAAGGGLVWWLTGTMVDNASLQAAGVATTGSSTPPAGQS